MEQQQLSAILAHPQFKQLMRKRTYFAWYLSAIMFVVYLAFILAIAFEPTWLGIPLAPGLHTTVGIPIGVGIILLAFVLTGIYVRRCNKEFDVETKKILQELVK